jgi:D-tyrosyl-tRNA(Tyr) deacylase
MRVVIQRVSKSSVTIKKKIVSSTNYGMLIFLGIEEKDTKEDINWLVKKISQLRIFNDKNGIMNLNVNEINGKIMVISQFTLHAKIKKGNRPSYNRAAKPNLAIPLYNKFINALNVLVKNEIKTGEFGAMMEIDLINDGPVTILIDSKQKE